MRKIVVLLLYFERELDLKTEISLYLHFLKYLYRITYCNNSNSVLFGIPIGITETKLFKQNSKKRDIEYQLNLLHFSCSMDSMEYYPGIISTFFHLLTYYIGIRSECQSI